MKQYRHCMLVLASIGVAIPRSASADEVYVNGVCGDDDWSGQNAVCMEPHGPKLTIQAAVTAANQGDEVIVADAIYSGMGNIDITIANKTIIVRSENGPANCTIDCALSGRGFDIAGRLNGSTVDGFTIENGRADNGGAIHCAQDSIPQILNCVLDGNAATSKGGAVFCDEDSQPLIYECVIKNNQAHLGGAVSCAKDSQWEIRNCSLENNSASLNGGGLFTIDSAGEILNCTIADNEADGIGGGMDIHHQDDVVPVTISNCTIQGNTNDGSLGGGLGVFANANVQGEVMNVTNCVFRENTSGSDGGGIYEYYVTTIEITNCTFSKNTADLGGAIFFEVNSAVARLTNSILWENSAPEGHEIYVLNTDVTIEYCNIDGGNADIENDGGQVNYLLTNLEPPADPRFVDADAGDLRLQHDSPCITRAGGPVPIDEHNVDEDEDLTELTPDLDLGMRKVGAQVDMGAYERLCPTDLDGNGIIDFDELLRILGAWGPCCPPDNNCSCREDLDADGIVGFNDLLLVLDEWGKCPGQAGPEPDPLPTVLACMGIDQECWEHEETGFLALLQGTAQEQANAICWLQHYESCHCPNTCIGGPSRCGSDPCGYH